LCSYKTFIFPIINPVANTINEVDIEGNAVYENVRLQFLLTKTNGWNERDIAKTFIFNLAKCSLKAFPIPDVEPVTIAHFPYSNGFFAGSINLGQVLKGYKLINNF
jgi:hypothetical protein